jgi:RNA polymerase-interacting CarD/CdnL/TRCF family regulator
VLGGEGEHHDTWTDRRAATARRLKSADLHDVALVIRDLTRHTEVSGKPLSSTEVATRDACVELLARELAVCLGLSHDEAVALVQSRASPLAK